MKNLCQIVNIYIYIAQLHTAVCVSFVGRVATVG